MVDDDTAAFLAEQGHGVLAFAAERPYAVPVSYGYDVDGGRCFLQLLFGETSEKRALLDVDDAVSLVVYEWEDLLEWRSVILTGTLREVESDEEPVAAEGFTEGAKLTDMSVFPDQLTDLKIHWYEMVIDSIEERHPTGDLF